MYELPSIEPAIRYLHGAAGFPTKATCLKAIRKGSYLSWPLVNVNNVSKYLPEYEETQKGHMRSQRQGVRSTKTKAPTREAAVNLGENGTAGGAAQIDIAPVPIVKKKDIFISIYNPCDTIYTDHTEKFPHASRRGYNYQMIIHKIDENSTWVEPTNKKS